MTTMTTMTTTTFKPRFKWEIFHHGRWTYLFCLGGPAMQPCPLYEERRPAEWHMPSDFCKATGACIHDMDVAAYFPRRDEISARLHADAVARRKAEAKARREHDAAHPRVQEPKSNPVTREQQIADALKAWPEDAPSDYSDLF
ncbi:MAG: hypothetical protein GYA24_00095 [Candidatus Lokiarchaeota archaeon]|nr:hypothetical protein [Candidatus Lokiarchaeota archaeon]